MEIHDRQLESTHPPRRRATHVQPMGEAPNSTWVTVRFLNTVDQCGQNTGPLFQCLLLLFETSETM